MPPKRVPAAEKEPLNELDLFAPITRRVYQNPVWSGKRIPAAAWRIYAWCVDHTTGNHDVVQDDGRTIRYGEVNGNRPVSFKTLAADLQCSWREAQRACEWLANNDLLTRGRPDMNAGYIYGVVNSTRKLKGKVKKYSKVTTEGDEEIQFLDDTSARANSNIEDEDDDLA